MKKRNTQKEITFESYLQRISSAKNNFESLNEDKYEYVYDEEAGTWHKIKKGVKRIFGVGRTGKAKKKLKEQKNSAKAKMNKMSGRANADKAAAKGVVDQYFTRIIETVRNMKSINMASIKSSIMSILSPLLSKFKGSKGKTTSNDSYDGEIVNKNIFSEDYELYNESIPFLSLRQNRNLAMGGAITISVNHNVDGSLRKEIYRIDEFANQIKFIRSTPALPTPVDYKAQIWSNIYKDTTILSAATTDTITVPDWKSKHWLDFYTFINSAASSKNTRNMADNVADVKDTTNKIDATTGRIETATGEINKKADKIDTTTTRTEQKIDKLISTGRNIAIFGAVVLAIIFIFFGVLFYFHFKQTEAIESESRMNIMRDILNTLKMEDAQKRAIDLQQGIDDSRAEIADLKTTTENRFTDVDNKLDIIEKNQSNADLKLNNILNQQGITDSKIDAINKTVKGIKKSIVGIASSVNNISGSNNKIISIINNIKNSQNVTNRDLADLTKFVKESSEKELKAIGLNSDEIAELKKQTQVVQDTVDGIKIDTTKIDDKTKVLLQNAQVEFDIKGLPFYKKLFNLQDYKDLIDKQDNILNDPNSAPVPNTNTYDTQLASG